MKTFVKLLALTLAVLTATALIACGAKGGSDSLNGSGDKSGAEEGAKNDDGGSAAEGENPWTVDSEMLRGKGYSVSLTRSNLYAYESSVNAESGSLAAIVSATKEADGISILVYYFKTEEQAAKAFETLEPVFKLIGVRIIHGDRDNVFGE